MVIVVLVHRFRGPDSVGPHKMERNKPSHNLNPDSTQRQSQAKLSSMRTFTLPDDTCIGTVKEATPQLTDERLVEIGGLDLLNDLINNRQMYAYDYEHSSSSSWSCDEDEDSIVLTRRRVDNANFGWHRRL
jgi:hypothetical protein